MPQFNNLDLRATRGLGADDKQREDFNALRIDAAKQQQKQFSEDERMGNTRWLAGGAKYLLENWESPGVRESLVNEGRRRGVLEPGIDLTNVSREEVQGMYDSAMAALGGQQPQGGTTGIEEYQFAVQQGYPGSFEDWRATKAPLVSIKNEGTIPTGYSAQRDTEGNIERYNLIPGSPEATAQAEAAQQKVQRQEQVTEGADLMVDEITRVFQRIGPTSGGFLPETGVGGAIVRKLPGTSETNAGMLVPLIKTLSSRIGFDYLQRMRENSPTGGALGQVSNFEIDMLQSTAGNIDPSQPDWMLGYNLARLYNKYQDVIHGKGNGPVRWRAPEAAYRRLYDNPGDPTYLRDFKTQFGYLPPGFE